MPLTPQDVHSKVFGPTRFRRGYDEAEVDAFLDEVEGELTRLHKQIDSLRSRLGPDDGDAASPSTADVAAGAQHPSATSAGEAQAAAKSLSAVDESKGDGSGDLEQRVARTLVLAQRAADEALRDAETHAEQVRAEAQAEGERVRSEAEEAAARERAAVESERSTAQDDVEQLRAFEREYRTRLRAYLELQLRELDGSGSTQVENRPEPAAVDGSHGHVQTDPAAVEPAGSDHAGADVGGADHGPGGPNPATLSFTATDSAAQDRSRANDPTSGAAQQVPGGAHAAPDRVGY